MEIKIHHWGDYDTTIKIDFVDASAHLIDTVKIEGLSTSMGTKLFEILQRECPRASIQKCREP